MRPKLSSLKWHREMASLLTIGLALKICETAQGGVSMTYTPFTLQDTSLIKSQLLPLEQGGAPWIKAFLSTCATSSCLVQGLPSWAAFPVPGL
uniref:Uncharacterized protein n=1 Tax=Monopterus albus TaxID=43700 RepID=A0A3Q3IKF3_MONAL